MIEQYDTVTVQELFEEELEAITYHHDELVKLNTKEALDEAEGLRHVISYFKRRLNDEMVTTASTLH